jgi:hypothetical protein
MRLPTRETLVPLFVVFFLAISLHMLRSLGYFDSAEHGAGLGGVYVPGSKPATLAGNATYGPNGSVDKSPVGRGSLADLERSL